MSISFAMEGLLLRLRKDLGSLHSPEHIDICSPAEVPDQIHLGLYLYRVRRDGMAQADHFVADEKLLVSAPLPLSLDILITAYTSRRSGLAEDYRLLDLVLASLHDGARIDYNSEIQPDIHPLPHIHLVDADADQMSKIWQFPNAPYRLSLCYELRPVYVPSNIAVEIARVKGAEIRASDIDPGGGQS
jgi:hypothetical protein